MRPRVILLVLAGAALVAVGTWQVSLIHQRRQLDSQLHQLQPPVEAALSHLQAFRQEPHDPEQLTEAENKLMTATDVLSPTIKLAPGELSSIWRRIQQDKGAFSSAASCLQQIEGLTLQFGFQRLSAKYTDYLENLVDQLLSLKQGQNSNGYTMAQFDQISTVLDQMQADANTFFSTYLPVP